jgi:hypothetical protein
MKAIATVLVCSLAVLAGEQGAKKDGYVPKEGYLPTKEVAIKIAVAVWEPIYGDDKIAKEKPYKTTLEDGVWTIMGSLPEGAKGGVALAEISKSDGRILRVIHGK